MSGRGPRLGIVVLFLMLALILYVAYQGLSAPFPNPLGYILALFFWIYLGTSHYGALNPENGIHKGKNFQTASGVQGTVLGPPVPASGGKITYTVSFTKYYVPKKYRESSFFRGIFEVLTSTQEVDITDYPTKFCEVEPNNCEAPEGAIMYEGRLDGGLIRDKHTVLRQRIEYNDIFVSQVSEIARQMELQGRSNAQLKGQDFLRMSEELRKMADNVKRINIIAKKGGGGVENIGDESGGI